MYPYLIVFVLFILCLNAKHDNRPFYLMTSILVLLVALRGVNVGVDTVHYYDEFLHGVERPTEPIWTFYITAFKTLVNDFQWFLFFTSLLTIVPLALFILKETENKLLALFVFFLLPSDLGYIFTMNALRQALAAPLILWAFHFAREHKWIYVAGMGVIAFGIHNSSIIFLLGLIAAILIRTDKGWVLPTLFIAVFFGFASLSISDVFNIIDNTTLMQLAFLQDYRAYEYYLQGEFHQSFFDTVFLIGPPIFMSIILYFNRTNCDNLYYKLYLIGTIILCIFAQVPMIKRYVMYFLLLEVVLLPQVYSNVEKGRRIPIYILLSFHAIVLFLYIYFCNLNPAGRGIAPYSFFFEH